MLGLGIGIGIGLTPHAGSAAGPAEVTVTEVRVVRAELQGDTTYLVFVRWTFSEDIDISNLDDGTLVVSTIIDDNGIDTSGSDWIELSYFAAAVEDITTYELQSGHGITSLVNPVVATVSGSVIPL